MAKSFDAFADLMGSRTGEDEFRDIEEAINSRPDRYHAALTLDEEPEEVREEVSLSTPPNRENPEPPSLDAPFAPPNARRMPIPSAVSGHDAVTPTPGGGVALVA